MVQVKFFSAGGPASGVELSGITSGTYDHIGYYGPDGFNEPVVPGAAQDISWIIDDGGIAIGGGLAESGQLNNNQWVDATGVSINSGSRVDLSSVVSSGSGTLRIQVTHGSNINISGAKLFAYDGTDVNNDPSGLWVLSYEIIPSGIGAESIRSGLGDTQWALIDSNDFNHMVDRTPDIGWAASGEFNYYVGLSIRPQLTQPSGLQNFGLYFKFDFS